MISAPPMDMIETQNTFIDAAKAAGARHLIKFSGLDARPDTTFPFGIMHLAIEKHLEKSGLAWTHLRPTGFMQEYLREAPSIINDGAFYLALADVRLNPVDLADVGKVGFLLLRDGGHEGERIPITGPEVPWHATSTWLRSASASSSTEACSTRPVPTVSTPTWYACDIFGTCGPTLLRTPPLA